jgi:hypothetical protein
MLVAPHRHRRLTCTVLDGTLPCAAPGEFGLRLVDREAYIFVDYGLATA